MKKYLMTGIAALALCAGFTSCSSNGDDIEQFTQEELNQIEAQKMILRYEQAFINAFGEPAANQTWGFSSTATRSVIKTDMTNYPKTGNPAAITPKEAEYVTEWFQKNPGLSEEGKPWKNFYVQFVSGDQTNKKGMWYRYDQNRPANEGKPANWEEEFTDNGGMDKLHVGATRNQRATDHINDFNAKTGGPWDVAYVENGSALQWGYHSSWGEDKWANDGDGYYWYFKMVDIEVPGECFSDGKSRVGCYVGLSLYGQKWENGQDQNSANKILGEQRLQYAEDWILKVTNADKPLYRVIAEDLNAKELSDFDFNDVVFDVVKAENGKTTLKLIAAGGVYKLTVAGREVHELFGQSAKADGTYPMVNTGSGPSHDPVEFQIDGTYTTPEQIKNIEIRVYKPGTGDNGVELTATTGKPACKILVDETFGVVKERANISNQYGNFTKYVGGQFVDEFWWK